MILTDANYEIMTLLRSHRDDAKGLQIMARHPYPLHSIRLRAPVAAQQLSAVLSAADAPNKLRSAPSWIAAVHSCAVGPGCGHAAHTQQLGMTSAPESGFKQLWTHSGYCHKIRVSSGICHRGLFSAWAWCLQACWGRCSPTGPTSATT